MERHADENAGNPGPKPKMRLRIFKSFEEAEKAEVADAAAQSPVEGLRDTVALILRVYGVTREQLLSRRKKLHINFISGQ